MAKKKAKKRGGGRESVRPPAAGREDTKSERPQPSDAPPRASDAPPRASDAPPRASEPPRVSDAPARPSDRGSDPSARSSGADAVSNPPPSEPAGGAPWARFLVSVEKGWTWFEVRLLLVVIVSLIGSMVFWVFMQGMASPLQSQSKAGLILRGLLGGIALGTLGWFATRPTSLSKRARSVVAMGGLVLGAMLAPKWRSVGVEYFGLLLNWLQEGSVFAMFGKLRGFSTRLTVLLAFIGGSLAAATGKHINIDVALRFVSPKLKLPVFVLQTLATIAFCVVAAWAFFDYIAITNFNVDPDISRTEKFAKVRKEIGQDLFIFRKQVGFDLRAAPHVLSGAGPWDAPERLNGRQWNEFVESSGYREYFTAQEVEHLKKDQDELDGPRTPWASSPDGPPTNVLVRTMNLTFAVGFLFMAWRFLLRLLLVVTGHQSMDAEADYDPEGDPRRHAEREKAAEAAVQRAGGEDHHDKAPQDDVVPDEPAADDDDGSKAEAASEESSKDDDSSDDDAKKGGA
ncbi:MAG: TRAP transporter small permease subunit [Polyangiaceae bacterium]